MGRVTQDGGLVLAGLGIAVLGLVSTRIGFASFQFRLATLTLLTGWLVAALGLAVWQRARSSLVGPILVVTAVAWFVPLFRWVAWEPVATVAGWAWLAWVPVLGSALLTFPTGRPEARLVGVAVAATVVVSLLPSPRQELSTALVLGASLIGVWQVRRHERWPGHLAVTLAGLGLCLVLGTWRSFPALLRLDASFDPSPLEQAAVVACTAALAIAMAGYGDRARRVSDLVVDLGGGRGSGLAGELGRLLGDPTVRLGLWLPQEQRFVDAEGRSFQPSSDDGSVTTAVSLGGQQVALLAHDARLDLGPEILSGIGTAASLASANAALQAELRDQVRSLHASRDRILTAGDQERAALEQLLRLSLEPQLDGLMEVLRTPPLGDAAIEPIVAEIVATKGDLIELAEGLGPRVPDGTTITEAVDVLVGRSAIPVRAVVRAPIEPVGVVRACLLFVIGEALTNIARHASATSVSLCLDEEGTDIRLSVADDGRGGADPAGGTGLAGLRDRVESLGGRFRVTSESGHGTRLDVALPAWSMEERDPTASTGAA